MWGEAPERVARGIGVDNAVGGPERLGRSVVGRSVAGPVGRPQREPRAVALTELSRVGAERRRGRAGSGRLGIWPGWPADGGWSVARGGTSCEAAHY